MSRLLIVHKDAAEDLAQIYDYIAERSGPDRARSYIAGIRSFLGDLCHYPERGSLREGKVANLRIIGFRKTLSIAFVAREADVLVLGFFYAGRNIDPAQLTQRVKATDR